MKCYDESRIVNLRRNSYLMSVAVLMLTTTIDNMCSL